MINFLLSIEDEVVLHRKEIRFTYISTIAVVVRMCKYSNNVYKEL